MYKEKVLLYIDDIRLPSNFNNFHTIYLVRSYNEAIDFIQNKSFNYEVYISFDHDLGEDKSGYDIAKYLVENQISIAGFKVHSANPVGVQKMRSIIQRNGWTEVF